MIARAKRSGQADGVAATKGTCLTKGCGGSRHSRGLCIRCFASARRLVNKGKVSDEQLVNAGLWLPIADIHSGGPFLQVFRVWEQSQSTQKNKARKAVKS